MARSLSPELLLAAACCRWPADATAVQRIHELAEWITDWDGFGRIVRRNRIAPLVHRSLREAGVEVPPGLKAQLARDARDAGRKSLIQACESLRLQECMEARGIPSLIVKGVPLAILAYGDAAMKEASDIDLIVCPDSASAARELLIGMGYEISVDNLTADEFARLIPHAKESDFFNARKGVKVDLHWRLVSHRTLLAGVAAHGPSQEIEVAGGTLRTLADEPLFAYLCAHGMFHNWSRIKWLADLSALISHRSESEILSLYEAASAYGARRSAAVGLMLCRDLIGFPLGERISRAIGTDRIAARLARNALAGLAYGGGAIEHRSYSVPWIRARIANLLLAPGLRHVFDELRVRWIAPIDRAKLPLPDRLEFVYHLLRVPLWLGRVARRAIA